MGNPKRQDETLVETSMPLWFEVLIDYYNKRVPFRLVDDALLGIDPKTQTLVDMAGKLDKYPIINNQVTLAIGQIVLGFVVAAPYRFDEMERFEVRCIQFLVGALICIWPTRKIITLFLAKPHDVAPDADGLRLSWR